MASLSLSIWWEKAEFSAPAISPLPDFLHLVTADSWASVVIPKHFKVFQRKTVERQVVFNYIALQCLLRGFCLVSSVVLRYVWVGSVLAAMDSVCAAGRRVMSKCRTLAGNFYANWIAPLGLNEGLRWWQITSFHLLPLPQALPVAWSLRHFVFGLFNKASLHEC